MPAGKIDTMSDLLEQIMNLLSKAKVVIDSDLPWILDLEAQVVEKLRSPITQMQRAGIMPAGGQMGGQMGGQGMDPMAPPPMAAPPGMPAPVGPSIAPMPLQSGGLSQGPGAPNPDELRRILSNNQ